MKLIGQFAPATRWQSFFGWLALVVLFAFLLPWIILAVGCILAGIVAIERGQHSLIICLPAGIGLLVLPILLFYFDRHWYQRVGGFTLDDKTLLYTLSRDSVPIHRQTDDVCWIENRMHRGRTGGYLVKFQDGSGIFVGRSLSNADELARVLRDSLNNRAKTCV